MTNTDQQWTIRAGWMADGSGSPLRQNVVLEIAESRIIRLFEASGAETAQTGTDLSDCLVLPGLIDAHVHLFMSGKADPATREWQLKAPFETMRPVIATHLDRQLASGVAAVRDGGDYAAHTLRFKRNGRTHGHSPLTLHAAGRAWRRAGRYGRLIGRPPSDGQTLARAVAFSREPVDHVKIVNSGLNSLKQFGRETAPQFTVAELRQAVETAVAAGRTVMVHANGRAPVRRAIAAGCHSIEHGFFMGADNLSRLAETGTFWVPTAVTMQGYHRHATPGSPEAEVSRRNLDHQLDQMRQARELGVKIAAGTDAGTLGVHHGRALREEIALLLAAGCSVSQAIQCATGHGADLMGLKEAGRLAPGCRATLLALPGGPRDFPDSLATPVWFMVDGRTVFDRRPTLTANAS